MSSDTNFMSVETSTSSVAGQPFRKAKLFTATFANAFAGVVHGWTIATKYQELERSRVPPGDLVRWLSEKL